MQSHNRAKQHQMTSLVMSMLTLNLWAHHFAFWDCFYMEKDTCNADLLYERWCYSTKDGCASNRLKTAFTLRTYEAYSNIQNVPYLHFFFRGVSAIQKINISKINNTYEMHTVYDPKLVFIQNYNYSIARNLRSQVIIWSTISSPAGSWHQRHTLHLLDQIIKPNQIWTCRVTRISDGVCRRDLSWHRSHTSDPECIPKW